MVPWLCGAPEPVQDVLGASLSKWGRGASTGIQMVSASCSQGLGFQIGIPATDVVPNPF
jgi:hypothetical protein